MSAAHRPCAHGRRRRCPASQPSVTDPTVLGTGEAHDPEGTTTAYGIRLLLGRRAAVLADSPACTRPRSATRAGITPEPHLRGGVLGRTGHTRRCSWCSTRARSPTSAAARSSGRPRPDPGMRQGNDVGTQYRSAIYTLRRAPAGGGRGVARPYQAVLDRRRLRRDHHRIARRAGRSTTPRTTTSIPGDGTPTAYCGLGGTGLSCPVGLQNPGLGSSGTLHLTHDVAVAADRAAPGQGREARSLHRDGAGQRPRRSTGPTRSPGCSSTPTPTRSGCPTRGSRSSTRSSTSATTPSPSAPTRPGSTSRRELRRARACRCSRVDTHRAGRRLRRARLQPLGRARLHERPQLHRPRRRPGAAPSTAARATRSSSPAGTAPSTPSRSPTSSTRSSSATARRSSARSPRSSARGSAAAAPAREARAARARRRSRASTCPSMYDVDVRRRAHRARSRPRYADVPARGREAHGRRPRRVAVPEAAARAAHRGGARPPQRRGLPRLHPRLPLLPGRDDHPPGARAPGRAGAHDGAATGLRRTGYDEVALTSLSTRRLLRHRRRRRRPRQRPERLRQRRAVACRQPAGRRVHRRHRQPRSRRCAAPASRSRPRPARGACAR